MTDLRTECPCVLVADDDPTIRTLVSTALCASGYDVIGAATGREAASILDTDLKWSAHTIDLLLVDVRMPGLNGLALLDHLRLSRVHLPVVLMTAFPDEHLRELATSHHVALLEKPFTLDGLRRIVHDELLRIRG